MSMEARIKEVKDEHAELRKLEMELKMKTEVIDAKLKAIIRDIGLPENFSMVDLIDKSMSYSPIVLPNA